MKGEGWAFPTLSTMVTSGRRAAAHVVAEAHVSTAALAPAARGARIPPSSYQECNARGRVGVGRRGAGSSAELPCRAYGFVDGMGRLSLTLGH